MAKAGRRNNVDENFVTHADIATDDVAGTLMSSSAGMERPAGMASETSFLVAAPLTGNAYADRASEEANLIAFDATQITSRVNRNNPKPGDPCHPLAALAHPPVIIGFANTAGDTNLGIDLERGTMPTITTRRGDPGCAAFSCKDHGADAGEVSPTLRAMGHREGGQPNGGGQVAVASTSAVRRLTPRECERLQGFPDDYTAVPYRGKPAADGPRYRALGNSMAVPVMAWIGQRIAAIDALPLA
jgi:DNA (cytosine-5)-methyltransferase 1